MMKDLWIVRWFVLIHQVTPTSNVFKSKAREQSNLEHLITGLVQILSYLDTLVVYFIRQKKRDSIKYCFLCWSFLFFYTLQLFHASLAKAKIYRLKWFNFHRRTKISTSGNWWNILDALGKWMKVLPCQNTLNDVVNQLKSWKVSDFSQRLLSS